MVCCHGFEHDLRCNWMSGVTATARATTWQGCVVSHCLSKLFHETLLVLLRHRAISLHISFNFIVKFVTLSVITHSLFANDAVGQNGGEPKSQIPHE